VKSSTEILKYVQSIFFDKMKVINYPLVFEIMRGLSFEGDLRNCVKQEFLPHESVVCMADCHDSILGDSYKFSSHTDSLLALSIILSVGRGIPLIYVDFIENEITQTALRFYQLTHGLGYLVDFTNSSSNLLIIRRANKGLFILNKSEHWYHNDHITLSGLSGHFHELRFNFPVHIEGNGFIDKWGGSGEKGIHIGPRDVLFLFNFD